MTITYGPTALALIGGIAVLVVLVAAALIAHDIQTARRDKDGRDRKS